MSQRKSPWADIAVGALVVGAGLGGGILLGRMIAGPPSRRARTRSPGPKVYPTDAQIGAMFRVELDRVAGQKGINPVPCILTRKVPNAAADGKRVYLNPDWARAKLREFCTSAFCQLGILLGVAAHEIEHHVTRRQWATQTPHERELAADYAAGQALALAQVPTGDFERLLGELSRLGTQTHPCAARRIVAIREGYRSALA